MPGGCNACVARGSGHYLFLQFAGSGGSAQQQANGTGPSSHGDAAALIALAGAAGLPDGPAGYPFKPEGSNGSDQTGDLSPSRHCSSPPLLYSCATSPSTHALMIRVRALAMSSIPIKLQSRTMQLILHAGAMHPCHTGCESRSLLFSSALRAQLHGTRVASPCTAADLERMAQLVLTCQGLSKPQPHLPLSVNIP